MKLKWKKSMWPIVFSMIAGILAIAGALYQYAEKEAAKKSADEKQIKIDEFNQSLKDANDTIREKQAEIIEQMGISQEKSDSLISLYQKLEEKNIAIESLQKENNNYQKAEGTYCYVKQSLINNNQIRLKIATVGSYPLKNIDINLTNHDAFNVTDDIVENEENMAGNKHKYFYNSLLGNASEELGIILKNEKAVTKNNYDFTIKMRTENSLFVQRLKFIKSGDNWLKADILLKRGANGGYAVQYRNIDDGFEKLHGRKFIWDEFIFYEK